MMKRFGVGALCLALAACGGSSTAPEDPFVAATPDVAGLTLESTGGAADGLVAHPQGDLGTASSAATVACEPYQYLCNLHAALTGLNTFVRSVVGQVEKLAATTPVSTGADFRVYQADYTPPGGSTSIATFRLTVKTDGGSDQYRFKLEGKKPGAADDTYVLVLGGRVKRGDLPHRGRGRIGIDLDALATLNPSPPVWTGQGKLLAAFAHVGRQKALVYAIKDFTPSSAIAPVPSAVFVGHKLPDGRTRVRLAGVSELVGPKTGTTDVGNELLLSRAGWWPGVGGRAAVVVAGGDVPGYGADYFLGLSCWNQLENEVFRALFACKGAACLKVPDADAPAGFNVGDPATCPGIPEQFFDDRTPPANNPASIDMEPGLPTDTNSAPESPPSGMDELRF